MSSDRPKKDGFTRITSDSVGNNLVASLQKTVDKIRDIHTQLGRRLYIVRQVKTRWSGGARGVGIETVIDEMEILPTPMVTDLSTLTQVLTPVGLNEAGSVQVTEVSRRYSEERLLGLDADGDEPAPDEHVYWEIEYPREDGRPPLKRRFTLSSAPSIGSGFQWRFTLSKTDEDRGRDGSPKG